MSIPTLRAILAEVERQVDERVNSTDLMALEEQAEKRKHRPFGERLLQENSLAIVAEIKRASPHAGAIRLDLQPAETAQTYERTGAHALAVVTCGPFFHGRIRDLERARKKVALPVLCRDFVISGFQILEAAAVGADAMLLQACVLDDSSLQELTQVTREWGLEVVHEVHNQEQLDRILNSCEPTIICANSRDLETMEPRPETALALAERMPAGVTRIFGSGVQSTSELLQIRDAGFHAALIGESLLRSPDPGFALGMMLDELADHLLEEELADEEDEETEEG